MTRFAVPSLVVAVVVLALAVVAILLGVNLLPTKAEAIQKGTYAPWLIVWGMIAIADICALLLATFLFRTGMRGLSAGQGTHART
jgi:hypothetical protein